MKIQNIIKTALLCSIFVVMGQFCSSGVKKDKSTFEKDEKTNIENKIEIVEFLSHLGAIEENNQYEEIKKITPIFKEKYSTLSSDLRQDIKKIIKLFLKLRIEIQHIFLNSLNLYFKDGDKTFLYSNKALSLEKQLSEYLESYTPMKEMASKSYHEYLLLFEKTGNIFKKRSNEKSEKDRQKTIMEIKLAFNKIILKIKIRSNEVFNLLFSEDF